MFDNFTLVIATKKRHHYLDRITDYYSNSGIQIVIADATKERYQNQLSSNITYYHYPEALYCNKLNDVFKKISTKYSMLCADDDFIIPNAISICLNFLNDNPDYNSAQGNYIFFYHSKNKLFYFPGYLSTIGIDFKESKAIDRIKKFNTVGIQFFYCVHKTETLQEVFSFASNKIFNLNLVELLIGMATVIKGKHKVLPVFYSVRELLYGSAGKSHGLDVFSTLPNYKEQYQAFFSQITHLLSEKDNISVEQASDFLKQSIQKHIDYRYSNKLTIKKRIIALGKKSLPFGVRKRIRHFSLLLKENKNNKNNLVLSTKFKGFPFLDGPEKKELERIESYIKKYNIHQ